MTDEPNDSGVAAEPVATPGPTLDESAPAVMVMRMVQKMIIEARKDPQHKANAENAMRVLVDVQRALAANRADPGAIQWLRQLALTWNTRLRNQGLKFRRLFELLDQAGSRSPGR
jgi:hypothetical protein